MGKIANEIFISDILNEGKKFPKVTSEGYEKGVSYYVKEDTLKKSYFLEELDEDDYLNILEQIKSNFNDFQKYLPKFGKYEIEEFIKQKFLHALLITGNFTDLFNTEIYLVDFNSRIRISSEYLLKKLLPCFIVTKTTDTTFYLKFKWEKQEA